MNDNFNYMYKNKYTFVYKEQIKQSMVDTNTLSFTEYLNVTILPAKEDIKKPWGIGGVLDDEGNYVPTYKMHVFGGKYKYFCTELSDFDNVIYIPVMPKQWGHFIIDVLCRFWWFDQNDYKDYKIAYISKDWPDSGISGNYLEILQLLLGENVTERLVYITRPTRFKRIIIPQASFEFEDKYHLEYKKIIDSIIRNANLELRGKSEKIYLSRTGIPQYTEVGEREIEYLFEKNGYKVVHPEKLSFTEQLCILQNAKIIVGISGSNIHNIIFAKDNISLVVINRAGAYNPPQLRLNTIRNANVIMIDVYDEEMYLKHPHGYGSGPFLISINENLKKYCKNTKLIIPYSDNELRIIKKKNSRRYYQYVVVRFVLKAYKKILRLIGLKKR